MVYCWQLWLTYHCTSLDAIAGVIIGSGNGGQFTVGRGDVSKLVAQIWPSLVEGRSAYPGLLVNHVV